MKLRELQQELRRADPAAILVSPRVLDRVIRLEQKLPRLQWTVPHRKCYVVDRHVLFRHVDQDELNLESDRLLPPTVILLAGPRPEELAENDPRPLLLKYWRRLFHASLHLALQTRCDEGKLTAHDVRERIERIGPVEFEEIRRVLVEDGYLSTTADDRAVFIEFATVFLECEQFAGNQLPAVFPAIRDHERVRRLLAEDVDAETLCTRTRLAGAPDPVVRSDNSDYESHDHFWKLVGSAEWAAQSGNSVRAAILHTRAARVAPAAYTARTRAQAEADLKHLVVRLQAALPLSEAETIEWLQDLLPLLDKADQGRRPVEAALLYDLQQVCLDHERDIYALDLVEWVLSIGKRPIKRPLPSQRVVRITKHLRSTAQLLTRARLSDADRQHLARLLQAALDRSEQQLRDRFRPVLAETFRDVGLQPSNPPEQTAFQKTIEELLDRISEYGYLTCSDLRDAISRNQLKVPDLSEPDEFVRGDPLLRLDRRLSTLLDGVYRPAEFYLRWLEHFAALSFGTVTGRIITKFVTVPFGGAVLLTEGLAVLLKHLQMPEMPSVVTYAVIVVLGFFLLGLIHVPPFRRQCTQVAVYLGKLLYGVLIGIPVHMFQITALRQLLESWPFQLLFGFLLKPLAVCALLRWGVPEAFESWLGAVTTFLATNFVLNSRPGLAATEALLHLLAWFADLLRAGLLPGLFRLIVVVFKQAIEAVEYVLFSVDEWLRFRSGDSKFSMGMRTVLGVLWFPVSYLARFYMVVLIEPGINPIKFPVSSLAAKFIYSAGLPLMGVMFQVLEPLTGSIAAQLIAGSTFWLLPDAFGFLFWEMKENWSLYRANRRPTLQPTIVGTHGETVRRLLQPGFHSGTLPKIFARLRRAERDAAQTGNWKAVRVCGTDLQAVERALQRLVEREVVVLVQQSPHWKEEKLRAGRVALASNRISLELAHVEHPADPVWVDIEDRAGWLLACFRGPGWLEKVTSRQRQAVTIALAGFYKLAGIDLIREQLETNLPREFSCYDISADDLVVWLDHRGGLAILYDWSEPKGQLQPHTADGLPAPEWPVLDATQLMFARVPITWEQWVETWQKDQEGQATVVPFSSEVRLLPAVSSP